MPLSGCPNPQQIREFLLGQLPADVGLASHLDECEVCGQLAEELDAASDSIIANLRVKLEDYEFDLEAFDLSGTNLGDYQLIRRIGAGGMGTVYQGRHVHLKKLVAIKLLPMGPTISAAALPRFRMEMEAAARVDDAHVVRAMDAREINGQHFLVMEHVDGIDLAQLVQAEGPLPLIDACEIIRQAALGVHSIHAAGMIHRDIKPSNLILSSEGIVKVVDLGLAFLDKTESPHELRIGEAAEDTVVDAGESSRLTRTGHRLGTPQYVAPEQAMGSPDVDWRADIFSLSCTLFFLVSGAVPFRQPWGEPPSNVRRALRSLPNRLPRRLEDLLGCMLSPDPQQRNTSALEVAERLESILLQEESARNPLPKTDHGQGLNAMRAAVEHRKSLLRRRRRLRTLTIGGTLAAMFAGLVSVAFPPLFLSSNPTRFDRQAAESAAPASTPDVVTLKLTPDDLADMDRIFFATDLKRVSVRFFRQSNRYTIWDAQTGEKLLEKHLSSPQERASADNQYSLETVGVEEPLRNGLVDSQPTRERAVRMFGTRSLKASADNSLSFFDLENRIDVKLDSGLPRIEQLAMSFNGRYVAATGGDRILIWHFDTQSLVKEIAWPGANRVYLSSDGRVMACISHSGELLVSRWEQEYSMTPYTNGELDAAAFAWNAPALAYADRSGYVMLLDCNSFKWLTDHQWDLAPDERFLTASFSEDRTQLALATTLGKIYRINVDLTSVLMSTHAYGRGPPLELVRSLSGHRARVTSLAFASESRRLVSGGDDQTVRVFDWATGNLELTDASHASFVRDVAFCASQRYLLSASEDLTVKGFAWPSMKQLFSHEFPERPAALAGLPDVDTFVVSTIGGKLYRDSTAADGQIEEIAEVTSSAGAELKLCLTRAGHVLAADVRGQIHEFDLGSGKLVRTLPLAETGIASLALSEDKGLLAAGGFDGSVQTWRWPEGDLFQHWRAHDVAVSAVCFSPSGGFLASGCRHGELRVWESATCLMTGLGAEHSDTIRDIQFSPDGRLIATASHDGVVKLWYAPYEPSE